VILTLSLLKTGGLAGFRDGLAVIRGLTATYWNDLYPTLDPEDNTDPTERLNILNNLSSAGESYRFAAHVKQVGLCDLSLWLCRQRQRRNGITGRPVIRRHPHARRCHQGARVDL